MSNDIFYAVFVVLFFFVAPLGLAIIAQNCTALVAVLSISLFDLAAFGAIKIINKLK